jgi:RNA recognition motif-containing protein
VARRGRGTHLGPPRSFAKNPGRPIVNNSDNRENPEGVTLFVFYIPNDMTNHDLHELFKPHGNILSVSIKTEEDTGRGRGYGFVSFEKAESAASAIQHLNGYQVRSFRQVTTCLLLNILMFVLYVSHFPSTLRYMANV